MSKLFWRVATFLIGSRTMDNLRESVKVNGELKTQSDDYRMDVTSLVPAGLLAGQVDLFEVQAGYNKFSENLRRYTPQAIQCAIFCGGSRCKYENPKAWQPVHMAIQNIFSHW